MDLLCNKSERIRGEVKVPGDKSISHRAAILLSVAKGRGEIDNFLHSDDCLHTLRAMRMMGVEAEFVKNKIEIKGRGKNYLKPPPASIYLGNSGTSMRLLSGIFSAVYGSAILYGDNSLNRRPMNRIINPLMEMGACVKALGGSGNAPLYFEGRELQGIGYGMDISSAQVKSAIMIASLFASGRTTIIEKSKSRDHTERMMKYLGVSLHEDDMTISMECGQELHGNRIVIPGDTSSAAFLIGAALLMPESELIIRKVLLNPTRTGFLDAVCKMGGKIEILDERTLGNEEVGDIRVRGSELHSIVVEGDDIPRMIDEIPLIAVLASFAEGTTMIRNAGELRFKESNRIKSVIYNLNIMGVEAEELEDGMSIKGKSFKIKEGYDLLSYGDHRIAMAFSLAGMVLGNTKIRDCRNISTSFPGFVNMMNKIGASITIK